MKIIVKVPGSCGELVQGMLNDEPFLITCPIDLYSTVTISDKFKGQFGLHWKSKQMFNRTLNYLGCKNFNFGLQLESDLLHGKGMASSSADITAVAKAVAIALKKNLSANEIAKLASEIEPTDGIFYQDIVAMNPLNGKIFRKFKSVPEYKIAIFDFGDKVNTLEFNRRSNLHLKNLPVDLDFDLSEISALANQQILFKFKLREIIHYAKSLDALGVNIAHTGTVIGIIFHQNFVDVESKVNLISKNFPHIKLLAITKIISGGFKIFFEE